MNAVLNDLEILEAAELDLDEFVVEEVQVEEDVQENVETEPNWEPAPERHCGCGCYER